MKLIPKIIFVILIFLLSACSELTDNKDVIMVGTSADNPPYEFMQSGQVVGLDIDIINAIGKKLEKKIVIKNFDFNGLLAALSSKNIDMIIAGLSVTDERKKYVSFSIPYIATNIAILYRSLDKLKSTQDLNNKVVGVQLGTSWGTVAEDLAKQINIKINYLSNNLMLVEELKSKTIDAVLLEEFQSLKFRESSSELDSFSLTEFSSNLAIAMGKDSKLKQEVDEAITQLEKDGEISKIRRKWLSK